MRRVPWEISMTRPASLSTFRCCETAGRLTGRPCARSPTADGPRARCSNTSRRVGSASAAKAFALVMPYRKLRLTNVSTDAADEDWRGRTSAAPPVPGLLLRQHLLDVGLRGVDRRRAGLNGQLVGVDREGVRPHL